MKHLIILIGILIMSCTPSHKENSFAREREQRIQKDFGKTEAEVVEFIKQYIPDVTEDQLRQWEKSGALEMRYINGEKRYFNRAARNLFRIDPYCRKIWDQAHAEESETKDAFDLDSHIAQVISASREEQNKYVKPVRLHIHYTLRVHKDAVPAGEKIRCWLPFPVEIPQRQTDITLLQTEPKNHYLAPANQPQRTVYLEKKAEAGKETVFSVDYELTNHAVFTLIDPLRVRPVTPADSLERWLKERPPHIVFTDRLRALSKKITGNETNPYRIAQKLFAWVDQNIPWASAREYSTISNLSDYAAHYRHGDCGIQTMLFITLCRLNGIPARWQSGWEFQPPHDSMHDWGMIYFKPYGWLPMDVTYGLRHSADESQKWFYLNGMDSYRLIFNEDFSRPFDPPKTFFRSETVDSQRGEAEWRGGNLYFDQWDWDMKWRVLSLNRKTDI